MVAVEDNAVHVLAEDQRLVDGAAVRSGDATKMKAHSVTRRRPADIIVFAGYMATALLLFMIVGRISTPKGAGHTKKQLAEDIQSDSATEPESAESTTPADPPVYEFPAIETAEAKETLIAFVKLLRSPILRSKDAASVKDKGRRAALTRSQPSSVTYASPLPRSLFLVAYIPVAILSPQMGCVLAARLCCVCRIATKQGS
ncbi:hypothetical protein Efla_003061 [Eimeria flavescens]